MRRLCVAVLIVSLVAAVVIANRRITVERGNRGVQIAVEWNEVRTLALAASRGQKVVTPAALLRELRTVHGVGALAVPETTIAELRDTGRVFLEAQPPAGSGLSGSRFAPGSLFLVVPDPVLTEQLLTYVQARRGDGRLTRLTAPGITPAVIQLNDGYDLLKSTGVGLPPEAVKTANEAGVEIVARVGNYPGLTPDAVEAIMARLEQLKVRNVVFTGTEVLGNKKLLKDVAEVMLRHHVNYGFLEFGKQVGDTALARLMHGQVVRAHSISDAEMSQFAPPDAIERFVKAARERGIRLLYLRFFMRPAEDIVAENGAYLDGIVRGLNRVGLTIGRAHPFAPLYTGRPLLIATGAGVVAGTVLLLALAFSLAARTQMLLLLLGIAGSSLLLAVDPTTNIARKLLALVSALVFPTLALLRYGNPGANDPTSGEVERPNVTLSPLRAVGPFLAMSATTLAGALLIVGLLGDTRFILKYDQFAGIKAAHLLPIVALVGILIGGFYAPAEDCRRRREHAIACVRGLLPQPIQVWQIVGLGVGMLFLLLLLLRTGNDPGVGVSPLELKFRAIMDRVLFVRPRTKEFLIGHPAMIIALWAGMARWRGVWLPALLIGAIGQVSLLNTFCHIHSPLTLSVIRALNGMLVGAAIGLVVLGMAQSFLRRDGDAGAGATSERGGGPRGRQASA